MANRVARKLSPEWQRALASLCLPPTSSPGFGASSYKAGAVSIHSHLSNQARHAEQRSKTPASLRSFVQGARFINDLGTVIGLRLDSSRSRVGIAPALFFRCRVSTSKKNGLKDHLARYRQIKVNMIGRKPRQTISIPDFGSYK